MKMLINGDFVDKDEHHEVINPYNSEVVDTVPIGDRGDVNYAIESANIAKKELYDLSAKEISNNLFEASLELEDMRDKIAKLIVFGSWKTI